MKVNHGWDLLKIFKSCFLTLLSILLTTLMGGVLLPFVNHFLTDMILWLSLSVALAVGYMRAAYAYRRRLAKRTGEVVNNALSILSDVSYEVLALLGGGFFGVLFSWLAWKEYRNASGFAGYAPLMTCLAVIGLGACMTSLVKFLHYLRTDMTIELPKPTDYH